MKFDNIQELFDTVILRMRKQGKPSIQGSKCLYRGPNGLKCAVGCVLDNKQIRALNLVNDQSICGMSVRKDRIADVIGFRSPNTLPVLEALQDAHDSAHVSVPNGWLSDFERRAREVATNYGLKYPEPA